MESMKTLKARVENGRIVMNEPTDLPEGTELELIPAADFDPELAELERAKIRAEMKRRFADSDANPDSLIPHKQVMKELFPELPEEQDDE